MHVEEITRPDQAEDLRTEWTRLWDRCPSATPFHSAEWLLCWWRNFGFGKLFLLALRDGGELVGLAPLFLHVKEQQWRQPGEGNTRQVSPIGVGITDYMDFLIEPGRALAGTEVILRHLKERQHLWDECDLQGIRGGSALSHTAPPDSLPSHITESEPCPVTDLPSTPEALLPILPAEQRRTFRRASHKLFRSAGASMLQGDESNLQGLLTELFRLHEARWSERKLQGVLGDPTVQRFHREVAGAFLKRGWLRLKGVVCDGSIAAVLYAFASRGTCYYYQSGFDPRFKHLSPGTVIIGHALQESIRENLRQADFLRGREPYKYLWGARDRLMQRLFLWPDAAQPSESPDSEFQKKPYTRRA